MKLYSIKKSDFESFVTRLTEEYAAYYLREEPSRFNWKTDPSKRLFWQEYKGNLDGFTLGKVRAQDPLKQFVFSAKQKVAQGNISFDDAIDKPMLLIGAKNCDLTGLDITDFVFMQGDFKDPFYVNRREKLFIIAGDCSGPLDTCFCVALGKNPFPEKNYDMAVTDVGNEYLVEVATDKAAEYVSQFTTYFMSAGDKAQVKREQLRSDAVASVCANIEKYAIPQKEKLKDVMEKGFDSKVWADEVKTCVECGCCNVVCPTCHCFFLGDSQEENTAIRHRIWDACLYKDFAAVAGGANPRKHLAHRLRNRYDKKFSYFPAVSDKIACTGCGRCITGCPGKIDIRRILKNLVAESKS